MFAYVVFSSSQHCYFAEDSVGAVSKKYVRGLLISKRRTRSQKRPNVFFSATHFINDAVEMCQSQTAKATSMTSVQPVSAGSTGSAGSHTSVQPASDIEH